MIKTFNDFLTIYPRYTKFTKGTPLEDVFNIVLSSESNIIKMINFIENDITPVAACAIDVEEYLKNHPSTFVTLDRKSDEKLADNCRQAIGAMIAIIISPFGYEKIKGRNRPIPNNYKGEYLSTGATYSKTGDASFKVIQKIIPLT